MTPLDMKIFLQDYPDLINGIHDDMNALDAFNLIGERAGFRKVDDDEMLVDVLDEMHDFIEKKYG